MFENKFKEATLQKILPGIPGLEGINQDVKVEDEPIGHGI